MITAKVSITKKRPSAERYSSDAYSATIEVELPDTVYTDGNGDLKKALAKLFNEVEGQVDAQMGNGPGKETPGNSSPSNHRHNGAQGGTSSSNGSHRDRQGSTGNDRENGNSHAPPLASSKQVNYLISLCKRNRRMRPADITQMVQNSTGKAKVYDLNVAEASRLIEELKKSA